MTESTDEVLWDPEVIHEAGIQPTHLARLLDISRVTASGWLNNHTSPHALLKGKIKVLMKAVSSAVEDGKLPVSSELHRDERSAKTIAIVRRYMRDHDDQ